MSDQGDDVGRAGQPTGEPADRLEDWTEVDVLRAIGTQLRIANEHLTKIRAYTGFVVVVIIVQAVAVLVLAALNT